MASILAPPTLGDPELVVLFKPEADVRRTSRGLLSSSTADVTSIQSILDRHNGSLSLLFGPSEERIRNQQTSLVSASAVETSGPTSETEQDGTLPDLASFYRVHAPLQNLETLAKELYDEEYVEAAYVKPAGSPPIIMQRPLIMSDTIPATTPNFLDHQGYLKPAPEGIDALNYAHNMVGGQGEGIRIIDVEWGWRFTHEDLMENQGGVVSGTGTTDLNFVNHGTAVAGVLGGDRNPYGITGIVPRSIFSGSSLWDQSTSTAIKMAADKLAPRDLILLEVHRSGPKATGFGQDGYIAIEWWPDDFAAIKYATQKGIIVVEAAGNGNQNLDDPIYDTPQPGFPNTWTNPFNPRNPSSNAVIVGAGAPPPGTHSNDHGPDRSRLWFSNYGARVDAQGWGEEVTTTGYGWLQGGSSPDLWYTDGFNGTSSASPIVTGALASVQGILKDFGRTPLTPRQAITILRNTGSRQQDGPNGPATFRIGNRPNLREMVQAALNRQ